MPSSPTYLRFLLDQLSSRPDVTGRAMMGEYVLYCRGVVVGGVYDDRLLLKPTPAARRLLPDAPLERPYPGAREMLLVEEVDDRDFLTRLFDALADEASAPVPLPQPTPPKKEKTPPKRKESVHDPQLP
ncbi:MAG: TfoX/Sxy family protein [Clostridia bacterium]|nr:TfoX/Sxy family protein [Clostridia bacterium]